MKYIYGPIKSRRLGFSLGVSLTPHKVCSFDCIYCQWGFTTQKTQHRKEYIDIKEIIRELKVYLDENTQEAKTLDYITLSGMGEPTLNIKIGSLIAEIKKISRIPLAVITNASLLGDALVRSQIIGVDLIVPSLDAVSQKVFEKIDRPPSQIKVGNIIDGLIELRMEFKGKIWLEVMLVKGVNDGIKHIKKLKEVIEMIKPDKIQLNSPVRSLTGQKVSCVDKAKLAKIKQILGDNCEII